MTTFLLQKKTGFLILSFFLVSFLVHSATYITVSGATNWSTPSSWATQAGGTISSCSGTSITVSSNSGLTMGDNIYSSSGLLIGTITAISGNLISFSSVANCVSGDFIYINKTSTTVPGPSDTVFVNHPLTLDANITLGNTTYTFNANVTDNGTHTLTATTSGGKLMISNNSTTTFGGSVTWDDSTITVNSGSTMVIGTLSINNGTKITIAGNLYVNGNVNDSNNGSGTFNVTGFVQVYGNYTSPVGGVNVSGAGIFQTSGTITTSGSSTVGGTPQNCTVGPCSSGSIGCGDGTNSYTSSVSPLNQTLCSNQPISQISFLTNATGTLSYQWEISITNGGTDFAPIPGATNPSYTPTQPTTTTWYRMKYSSSNCSGTTLYSPSSQISMNNYPAPVAGSISGGQTYCSLNKDTILTLNGNNGMIQWQKSTDNITFSNISGQTSSSYQTGNLSATTYYRVVVSNGSCNSVNSASVAITFASSPTIGSISAPATLCAGSSLNPAAPTITTNGSTITASGWQLETTVGSGNFANLTTPYDVTFADNSKKIRYYATTGCGIQTSNEVTITANDKPTISPIMAVPSLSEGESYSPALPTVTPNGSTVTTSGWQIENCGCGSLTALTVPYIANHLDDGRKIQYFGTNGCGTTISNQEKITVNKNKTWIGTSPNWFDAFNWKPNGVPSNYSDVIIPNTTTKPVIDGANTEINKLSISSGGSLKLISTLTVTDVIIVDPAGEFKLENNASLIQRNNVTNSGSISVKRDSAPLLFNDYTYWASPTTGSQTLRDFSPNSNPKYFLTYINKWNYISSSNKFTNGLGYAILAPLNTSSSSAQNVTFTFMGTPNNGNIKVYSDYAGANSSKLIGNPYPSAIDAVEFILANLGTIDGTLYFWTHNNALAGASGYLATDYATITLAGVTPLSATSGHGNTSTPNGFISSGQGFLVNTTNPGDILFTNSMRLGGTSDVNNNFYRNIYSNTLNKEVEKNRIWLNLTTTSNTILSQLLVGYIEKATNDYDRGFDGVYKSINKTGLYSLIGKEAYAIQAKALPFGDNDKIPLGYKTDTSGTFTISIEAVDGIFENGQDIFIEDKLSHTLQNLKVSPYTFNTEAGTFNNRFVLKYTNTSSENDDSTDVLITSKNRQIKIQSLTENIAEVYVYDILGRTIYQNSKIKAKEIITSDLKTDQVLIVKVILSDGKSINRKLFIE